MKKIAIIGAGLSGLCSAKTFLQEGYDVSIFEKGASLGGVWAKERSYPLVRTQTTRDEYAFSDFKMPSNYPQWPTGEQVFEYLQAYAKNFGVFERVQLNHEVKLLTRKGSQWELTIQNQVEQRTQLFDFVVVCSGTFHKPKLPLFPNQKEFLNTGGVILHSSELKSTEQLKNKDVMVVGFAKSATDVASLAADNAKSCTLVYRKAQWKVPRFFANSINMKYLLFSRFSEAFFNYHSKTTFERFLHSIGKPLVWMQWRGLEALLTWQFGLRKLKMVPDHSIEDQISCSLGVEPENFYKKIKQGKIRPVKSNLLEYQGNGVRLHNHEFVKADLVIFGTGFLQDIPFLDDHYRNLLIDKDGSFRLYRSIINPEIPDLAFVGFNSSLFTTLTSEVAAKWVLQFVKGKMVLPSKEKMLNDIQTNIEWRTNGRPIASEFSGTCIAPFNYHHLDELLTDMQLRTRKTNNVLVEFLKPINPSDYKAILENRNHKYSKK